MVMFCNSFVVKDIWQYEAHRWAGQRIQWSQVRGAVQSKNKKEADDRQVDLLKEKDHRQNKAQGMWKEINQRWLEKESTKLAERMDMTEFWQDQHKQCRQTFQNEPQCTIRLEIIPTSVPPKEVLLESTELRIISLRQLALKFTQRWTPPVRPTHL